MRLTPVHSHTYAGLSYEQASRQAQEVCRIAARTGQTRLAADHLGVLVQVMRACGQTQ